MDKTGSTDQDETPEFLREGRVVAVRRSQLEALNALRGR